MARKRSSDAGGGYSWMDTYGDMVTLLLTFFIMLFSMSSVDAEKWEVLVKAFSRNEKADTQQVVLVPAGDGDNIASALGEYDLKSMEEIDIEVDRPATLSQLYEYVKAYVDENDMSAEVTVEKDASNNVYLRFDNNIFFGGNSSILKTESLPILQFLGECLKSVESEIFVVRVSGHTAQIPGDEAQMINDWDLSSARANRVANYFEEVCAFDPTRLMTNGWGRNHPRFANDTEENRAKNRRVELMVLGNEFDTGNAEQMYDVLRKLVEAETMTQTEPDAANGADILIAEQGPGAPESAPEGASSEVSSEAAAESSEAVPPEAAAESSEAVPPEAASAAPEGEGVVQVPTTLTEDQIRNMTAAELETALASSTP